MVPSLDKSATLEMQGRGAARQDLHLHGPVAPQKDRAGRTQIYCVCCFATAARDSSLVQFNHGGRRIWYPPFVGMRLRLPPRAFPLKRNLVPYFSSRSINSKMKLRSLGLSENRSTVADSVREPPLSSSKVLEVPLNLATVRQFLGRCFQWCFLSTAQPAPLAGHGSIRLLAGKQW